MIFTMMIITAMLITAIMINAMPYIPTQRRMPRHSSLGIAMMKMFDRPAMVPIEY